MRLNRTRGTKDENVFLFSYKRTKVVFFEGLLRFINNEKHSVFHAISVKKENENRIENKEDIWGQTRVLQWTRVELFYTKIM